MDEREELPVIDEYPRELIGTVSPLAEGPSFAIPVFRDSSGRYSVQKIDNDDTIIKFDVISNPGERLRLITSQAQRKPGELALWAVDFGHGELLVETRTIVPEKLRDRFAQYLSKPFFLLDIAEFLADTSIMHQALRGALQQLEKIDQTMASDWLISYCCGMIDNSFAREQNLRRKIHILSDRKVLRRGLEILGDTVELVDRSPEYPTVEEAIRRIIGKSDSIKKIRSLVKELEIVDVPCLIQGESGTGKEIVARAIHYNSPRKNKPFVTLN
jgi:hypothetical protein